MKRFSLGLVAIIILTLLMGIVALPESTKSTFPDNGLTRWIQAQKPTLGLDLQGGTQLDYRIDLSKIAARNADEDPENDVLERDVIEGVRSTIERRVDSLGVSEPNIYISNVGDEKHIVVELAGIKEIDEAKEIVGKTIQLEFKEPKTEEDAETIDEVEKEAKEGLATLTKNPEDFETIGQSLQTTDNKVSYRESREGFVSEFSTEIQTALSSMEAGDVYQELVPNSGDFVVNANGQITERSGFLVVKLDSKETRENTKTIGEDRVRASHILIAYEGSQASIKDITRSKEEAKIEAEKILEEVKADPENFADFAREYSEGPTAVDGGDLDFFSRGVMAADFETAAFELEVDEISEVVETEFGFHIIKATDKEEASEETVEEDYMAFSSVLYDTTPDPWKLTGLDGSHFKNASVVYDQLGQPVVSIQFDKEGSLMFEELTDRLRGQQLAIFVGGELISAPSVNEKIIGGQAQISGNFNTIEAVELAKDLNTGAIDAPIVLTSQYNISASLGENALNKSLFAGMIGLIALSIFMILYYRLMGVIAVIALSIYSVIIIFIINTTGIVMTLAGIAGIILSIGMAVDANILIFERTKEELKEGASYQAAIAAGFERAWSSIWDSNISSLITCVILWFFGNSIIRGFALMLGIGIIISMFTAVTVTKSFLQAMNDTRASKSHFWMAAKKK